MPAYGGRDDALSNFLSRRDYYTILVFGGGLVGIEEVVGALMVYMKIEKVELSQRKRLNDLADNIDILYDAFLKMHEKPHFYKEVVSRVYILVSSKGHNKPLLFEMAKQLNDPLEYITVMGTTQNLFDFIMSEWSIIGGKKYTNEEFVTIVRNQLGGGHEDSSIDSMHLFSEQIYIDGYRSDIRLLKHIANTVLGCAFSFIKNNGFVLPTEVENKL